MESCRLGEQRLVFAGTDHIYPSKPSPIAETDVRGASSLYGMTKLAATELCESYYKLYATDVRILVSSNVFGAGQEGGKVVPAFIHAGLRGEPLIVHGGSQVLDMHHVDNLVDAYLHVAGLAGAAGEIYHVGSGHGHSIEDIAQIIWGLTGRRSKIEHTQYRKDEAKDHRWIMDTSKLVASGWRMPVSFDVGIARTVREERGCAYSISPT